MDKADLIVIGAGPGGYRAAEYAAMQGLKVTIFEGADVGGTCLNVGCIPTKTYVHSATFDEARERMSQVVPQLRSGVESILSHPNITLVREEAAFVDAHTVNGHTAENIIIATGSETKWLPIPGTDDPRVVDSTGLLRLETLPKRLAIIGAGVIGMEFASVFNRFGSEVTVIEYLKECLPALDSDIAKRLRKTLEKEGIAFHMQCSVKQIVSPPELGGPSSLVSPPKLGGARGGLNKVFFENKKGQTESVDADIILMATGRKPRIQQDFAKASFDYDERKGITVDENFETTVKGIYAIGDVNGRQMLAHAAEMQAIRAVNHIIGKKDGIRFDIMPAAIFTNPEAACVGPSEDQLKAENIQYVCRKAFWRSNGKALAMDESEGLLKLFSDKGGRILGCHAFGAHAADLVQEVSVLMCKDTTVSELADMVHIHPTLSEILKAAAE